MWDHVATLVARGHAREERAVLGPIERSARDVREHLHPRGAKGVERAIDLAQGGLGVVHRQRGDEGGKAVRVPLDQRGHLVVGEPREVGADVGAADNLDGRTRQREHLHVALVAVHDPEAPIDVHEHRDAGHPLLERHAGGGDGQHPLEIAARQDVGEHVDLLHGGDDTIAP